MKRVFIIHGWSGWPEEAWFPWLKKELEARGFEVVIPRMPDPDEPKVDEWVSYLEEVAKNPDKDTYFVGHSVGCQTILRYLERLSPQAKVGGAVFVAGWFFLKNLASEKEWEIIQPWVPKELWKLEEQTLKEQWILAKTWAKNTFDFDKIKTHTTRFVAIFSDNDPYVPEENSIVFADNLNADILIEKNMGHFSEEDDIYELPVVLDELLRIASGPVFEILDLL